MGLVTQFVYDYKLLNKDKTVLPLLVSMQSNVLRSFTFSKCVAACICVFVCAKT